MPLTAQEIAILTAKRIGAPPTETLRLATLVPAALQNLAYTVANDPQKRAYLLTDQESTESAVVGSESDLLALLDGGVMLEYLQHGTVYYTSENAFTDADVSMLIDTITLGTHDFVTGQPIVFATAGTLPPELVAGTTYYAISVSDKIKVATTYQNALDDLGIGFSGTGSGSSTVSATEAKIVQWLNTPSIGRLETGGTPIAFIYGWLRNTTLQIKNGGTGRLNYAVSFVPTLDTLPLSTSLQQDLIDEMVLLATTGGPAMPPTAGGD